MFRRFRSLMQPLSLSCVEAGFLTMTGQAVVLDRVLGNTARENAQGLPALSLTHPDQEAPFASCTPSPGMRSVHLSC